MTDWISLIGFIAICFAASAIGGYATGKSVDSWYNNLKKPAWTPSGGFIGTVWLILYALMAIAAWLVWISGSFDQISVQMLLFFVQLGLNTLWSILFFGIRNLKISFIEVVIFWVFILLTLIAFLMVDLVAGSLFVPYLAWVTVASYLNYTIWRLNLAS